MRRKDSLFCIILVGIICVLSNGALAQEMRKHAGDMKLSLSGYLTSSAETNWRIGVSSGYYFTDSILAGIELHIGSMENSETITTDSGAETALSNTDTYGIANVFAVYNFPSSNESPFEPFIGLQAGGVWGDEGQGSNQALVGIKVGVNVYFAQKAGLSFSYEPFFLMEDEEIDHNFSIELFSQFAL